jgi:formylmethanofuran dehydrogenase subunit E
MLGAARRVRMDKENPREEIEKAVAAGNLTKLLSISGILHGHFCPFSALGVKAGARAMRDLEATSTGMEELIAIVETNNCFMEQRSEETTDLFEKVVVRREGGDRERRRLSFLWKELSFKVLEIPDPEVFDMRRVEVDVPTYARMFASTKCSVCGESVMEPRVRMSGGQPVCLACSDQEYYQLTGDGITTIRRGEGR